MTTYFNSSEIKMRLPWVFGELEIATNSELVNCAINHRIISLV